MDRNSIAEIVINELEYLMLNEKEYIPERDLLDFKHFSTLTDPNLDEIEKNIDKDLIIECIYQFLDDNDLSSYGICIYGCDEDNYPTKLYLWEEEEDED